jgi:L-rhamnonate dehydratase
MSAATKPFPTIAAVRTYVVGGVGSGGDYHNVKGGHWCETITHHD